MIIQTILFYIFFSLSIFSIIGYGALANINQTKITSYNIFNFFFFGIIVLLVISIFYYYLVPNNKVLNLLIFFFGLFLNYKFLLFKNYKIIFFISFLLFSGILISKTHEDFSVYHFQLIKELSDGYIKFGLSNLDPRYFYSSIFSFIQTLYIFPYFDYYLVNIPSYLIFVCLVGYLFVEILKKKINSISLFFLIFLIVKFKRFSEFGYDYISQFILIYIFIEYIYKNIVKNDFTAKINSIIFFSYSILIKVSNIYFAPIFLFIFSFKIKSISKIILSKKFLIFNILFLLIFTFNSFIKTGCLNYFIKKSCFEKKLTWVIDYKIVEDTKSLSINWARGFYHQDEKKLSEKEYNYSYNWINNWFKKHFIPKVFPNIIIIFLILFTINFIIGKNKVRSSKYNKILFYIFISNLIWLYFFPQFRFGIAGISILSFLVFEKIFQQSNEFNFFRMKILIILCLLYFNLSNFQRIHDEFKRDDLYKFTNFPYFNLPKLNFISDEVNGIQFNISKKNNNFWRTCYNSEKICVNHDDKVLIEKKGRNLFFIKN